MRRRIIKQGNDSYTITLPIKWIKQQSLQNYGEVEVEQKEDTIIIANPAGIKKQKNLTTADLKDYDERTILNILNNAYRRGFDEITVFYKNAEQAKIIHDIVRHKLLGFEITEESRGKYIIQNIAEPSPEKYEVIFRKLFLMIKEEAGEILSALKNPVQITLEGMKKREETKAIFDNYTNFCRRVVVKTAAGQSDKAQLHTLLIARLSLIEHAYYYLFKYALKTMQSKKKFVIPHQHMKLLEEANKMFEMLHESYYSLNIKTAHKIGRMKTKLIENKLYSLLEKSTGQSNVVLYHIGEIIRLVHMASTIIFGFAEYHQEA